MTLTVNRALAGGALLLGIAAAIVREPPGGAPLVRIVADRGTTALELAAWLRARRPVEILDVRPSADAFDDFHLPRARHVPVGRLRDDALPTDRTIVVYADGGDLAARAAVVLESLGYDSVRVLPDGVGAWLADIVNPVLPSDADQAAREAFARQAELSRYFGGLPRIVPAEEIGTSPTAGDALQKASRRGCAF